MASPYSTKAEFRKNFPLITTVKYSDADLDLRITQADEQIEIDLSDVIDFTLIATNPKFLNKLSQYKTAELVLIAKHGYSREGAESGDIQYWADQYNKLLKMIMDGDVTLNDGAGTSLSKLTDTFERDSMKGSKPKLGHGEWGDYVNNEDNAEEFEQDD